MGDTSVEDWRMRVRLSVVACFLAGGALLQCLASLHLLRGGF
ncbi:hypothetical protein [Caballeronia sp. HLA56]